MLAQARASGVRATWIDADIGAWTPDRPLDLIYANAALQWLGEHAVLLPRLLGRLRADGVLAVQMPRNFEAPSHALLRETARSGPWADRLAGILERPPVAAPAWYHDLLAPHAAALDIWETEYLHVLAGDDPVLSWTRGNGAAPDHAGAGRGAVRRVRNRLCGPSARGLSQAHRRLHAVPLPASVHRRPAVRMSAPALVVHADWSVHPGKRWMAQAVRRPGGGYLALPPTPVGALEDFWFRLEQMGGDGPIMVGFDFPIGLPAAYAKQAGIEDFATALAGFGQGRWRDFYEVAAQPEQIALTRPFYPARPGGRSRRQLVDGLRLETWQGLHRRCDGATAGRQAACPMFWTLGGNQVGKAMIVGWRDLLAPARRAGVDVAIWPFDGALADLLAQPSPRRR